MSLNNLSVFETVLRDKPDVMMNNSTAVEGIVSNVTSSYSLCPPWFPVQLKYRSDSNNTLNMECPDTIVMPIFSGVYLLFYISIFCITLVGLIWKRKSSHIRARSFTLILLLLGTNFYYNVVSALRFVVGRSVFPCFLYSLLFFMLGPCMNLPSIVRGLKHLVNSRINVRKKFVISNDTSRVSQDSRKTEEEPQKVAIERRLEYLYWINQKMESVWFSVGIYGVVLLIHLVIWFMVGIVEDNFYVGNRFFMKTGSIFSVQGCYITNLPSIILSCSMFLYSAIDILVVLCSIRSDGDTFSIKIETIVLAILRSFLTIVYFLCSQIFETQVLTHIIPYSYSVMIGGLVEVIVSVLIPVIRAIIDGSLHEKIPYETEIESVLNDDGMYKIFLEFARRSYCPEGVLFYKDCKSYKRLVQCYQNYKEDNELLKAAVVNKHKERITRSARQIIQVYLTEGSINELNIPSLHTKRNDVLAILQASEKNFDSCPPKNLFDQILIETLLTLNEVYIRLKYHSREVKVFVKESKSQQDNTPNI